MHSNLHPDPQAGHESGTPRIAAVQGLRGLAVLGVLLFHVGLPGVAGGYLGVDVFFVISGFVIATLLQRRVAQGDFMFSEFYLRRAWRLMPALGVTLLLTAAIFCVLTPSAVNQNLRYSLLSSVVGLSNIYFAAKVDYFDSGITNPVLHTWSLGVEEQFYLALPIVIVLMARARKSPLLALAPLAALSFAGAVYATETDPSSAFYMPTYRAWEFLAGAMVASVRRDRLAAPIGKAFSWLGLVLVLAAFVWYDEHRKFPGLGALAPVAGTALLILGTHGASLVNRVLTAAPLHRLGDVSYSVYLAHWPIVCLAGMFFPLTQLRYQLASLVASLVCGYLLWRWVEMPALRRYPAQSAGRRATLVPVFLASVFGTIIAVSLSADALWERNPVAQRYMAAGRAELGRFPKECFITYKVSIERYDTDACLKPKESATNLLVIGDSMAANVTPALRKQLPGVHILQGTAVDYRPGNQSAWPAFTEQLDDLVWKRLDAPDSGVSAVAFFARWEASDLPQLIDRIERLKQRGIASIVLGPSPEFYINLPLILSYSALTGIDLVSLLQKSERRALDAEFARLIPAHARYVSVMQVACPSGQCRTALDAKPLYFDRLHFSTVGADMFVRQLNVEDAVPLAASRLP